jgi:hypothetical protein
MEAISRSYSSAVAIARDVAAAARAARASWRAGSSSTSRRRANSDTLSPADFACAATTPALTRSRHGAARGRRDLLTQQGPRRPDVENSLLKWQPPWPARRPARRRRDTTPGNFLHPAPRAAPPTAPARRAALE